MKTAAALRAATRLFVVALFSSAGVLPAFAQVEHLDTARIPRPPRVASTRQGVQPTKVRVLVVEINPMIPGRLQRAPVEGGAPRPLNQAAGWNDPVALASGYMRDVTEASAGLVEFQIVDWEMLREFPVKADGFTYTAESYMASLRDAKANPWHQPDGVDYPAVIRKLDLVRRVESGEIDEVWTFGAPYFGFWEACMVGPGAFDVNGDVYDRVASRRRFVIMGFSYERGVAEMLEDLCHRTEATMSHFYGGWQVDKLTTTWARFAANEKQSGTAAVGTCHYPPNGERDYDWTNARIVESTADDWLHYPDLTGRKRRFNCEEWAGPYARPNGRPDYHRNYIRWWFTHLPKAAGREADGHVNNWWAYVFRFNDFS